MPATAVDVLHAQRPFDLCAVLPAPTELTRDA